jgi:Tfp pilus assembly protein PilF
MYRSDRYSRVDHSDFGPTLLVICTGLALGTLMACNRGRNKTASDTTTRSNAVATQSAVGGDVVDTTHKVPQNVTLASAQDIYSKRQYFEATGAFDAYVQTHPNNAFGHYMLGLSAWKSGDLERARTAFERSLALDSTNVKTLLNLGRVLLDQGKPDEAVVRISTAAVLDSGSAEVHRMLGRVQTSRGERDSAMTSYRVALSIDPADSWSMNNLGLLLIEQGRYEEALMPLARAVELRPEAPAFANNLGVALERSGHPVAAAEAYRAALKADSTYVKAARSLPRVDGKTDSTAVDVSALAAAFNLEIQTARQARLMAKQPESVKVPEW